MQVKVEQKLKRGVHRHGKKHVLIINWDRQHPCPPPSEWYHCERCDFAHPLGGHVYFSPAHELVFALDDVASELVRLGLISGVK